MVAGSHRNKINSIFFSLYAQDDVKKLVLILSWLQAERKHLLKFAQIYMDQGFDVVVTHINIREVVWPRSGFELISNEILKFLSNNNENYQKIVLHGFSIGVFLFGQCLVQMSKDRKKYEETTNRIVAQIWDSIIDYETITVGASKAFLLNHPKLHTPLQFFLDAYLRTFPKLVREYYCQSSEMLLRNFIRAPALLITSKVDPACSVISNEKIKSLWKENGTQVTLKCYDESPHVMHFVKYREDYTKTLSNHLEFVEKFNK